jgi:hypothetical protein
MTTRRAFLGTTLAATVATSGCLAVLNDDPIELSATDVSIRDEAVSEANYAETRDETMVQTREVAVADQRRTIEVTNHVAEYSRAVTFPGVGEREIARVVVFSTPQVAIADRTFNPVGDWSHERLVRELASRYDSLSNVSEAGERTLSILGDRRTVSTFTAEGTLAGGLTMDVLLHVARFAHGEDFVVALGVHPMAVDDTDSVNDLFGAIEHGA